MEATLVLESRGFAPQLRSAPFSAGWSRLYQAENYVLDLSCKVQDKHSSLQGHIMLDSNPEIPVGSVTLLHADEELACATLDAFGQFQINIDRSGHFHLRVDVTSQSFSVSNLRIE